MTRARRATISDVAAASGVGVGTVSRVINGAAGVRDATRARVLGAIEQLGCRPSHLAAALSRGTPRTVAIVIPHLTRPSSVERLAGALAVLARYEYDSIVCNVATPGRPAPRRWPRSCSGCVIRRRPSSPPPTPRPWACWRPPTSSGPGCRASCR